MRLYTGLKRNRQFFIWCVLSLLLHTKTSAQTIDAGKDTAICIGDSIKLGGKPIVASGTPSSYSWTSAASSTAFSTDSTPTVSPTQTTKYYLDVTYSSGIIRDSVTISILNLNAKFGLSNDTICSGTTVSFSDSTRFASSGANFSWNFGTTGANSTNKNPSHTFTTSTLGSGNTSRIVTLTVTDSSCVSVFIDTIVVKDLPSITHYDYGAGINGTTDYTNCVGYGNYTLTLENFSTTTSTNSTYTINWGDGSSSTLTPSNYGYQGTTSHTYTSQGYFYLNYSVTGSNGCVDSIIDTVFHGSNPVIGITNPGNTTGCSPYTLSFRINYRDTSGAANFPGTKYTIRSNYPGFVDSVYFHPSVGMPDSTFTFTFVENSCGYTANTIANGFYVEVIASNQCASAYSSAYPIHINKGANARFTNSPDPKICQGDIMSLSGSDSTGISINPGSPNLGCSESLKKFWTITPMTGVNVTSGALGRNISRSRYYGTKDIKLRFDSAGTFTIKYFLANYCGVDSFSKSICVVPKPNSSYRLSNTFLCNPDTMQIINTSPSVNSCDTAFYRWGIQGIDNNCSPSSPYWKFVDSTTSTSKSPSIHFLSAGIYKITLYDSSYCGLDSLSKLDTVATRPEIYFNVTADSICANSPLSIDTISIKNCYDPTATYLWTYSGGSIQSPTTANPGSFSSDSIGRFVISLKVTNRCSDTTYYDTITVLANPVISFTSLSPVCVDADSFILNNATPVGGIYSSNSNYIVSNVFYPSIAGVGTHKIYYIFTDSLTCSSMDSTTIIVHPLPNPNAGNDTLICLYDSIDLNPKIESNHTYSWYIGSTFFSNQTNVRISPQVTTQYILLDSNTITGCINYDTVSVTVNALPPASAGIDTSICLNDSIQLGSYVAGYNYQWTSNPTGYNSSKAQPYVSPKANTTYFLSVNAAYQCYNYDTVTITVDTLPRAFVGNTDTICAYDSIQIGGSSIIGNSYVWTSTPISAVDSIANPVVYPLFSTTYYLQETIDVTGCKAMDSVTIVVNQLPNVVTTDATLCLNDTVILSVTPSNLVSYIWSPSSSLSNSTSSSTLAYPTQNTTYIVSATDSFGCVGIDTSVVSVYAFPSTSFSIDTGSCGAVSLLVDNHTDSLSKYGHGYKWVVSPSTGVSLNDTLYEPSIVFPINRSSSAISYRLLLTSTSNQGCEDKDTQYTVVYPKPLAKYSFSLPDSCSPDTAYFTNLSDPYNSEGIGTMGFVWDFGSVQRDPKKRYTNTGLVDSLYAVELISESMHGCRDTFVDTVVIHPDTKADFAPILTSGCAPLVLDSALINLRQYVNANDGYSWTIWGSDSSTVLSSFSGTGFNSYTMSSDGDTVYVRLITSNNYGCSNDTLVRRFVTIKDPVADFRMSDTTGCGDTQISFRDASTPSGLSLRWDFGDGDTSVQTNPSHVFGNSSNTQDSIYTVRLIVTAGSGCSDTISKDIKLYPLPLAGYGLSSSSTCAPATLSTSNTSIYKGSSFSSQWSSSHGSVQINTTSSSTPSLVFPDNDSEVDTTYSIQLLVTSVDGCKDSITDSVEVYSRPNASFSIDTGSCGAVSLLADNHTDSLSKYGHGYKWVVSPSTGVSLNDTLYEPSIVFPINRSSSAISYRLLLTSTSNQGCEDKDTQYTVVYPKPLAKYSFSLPDSCSPDTAYFTNLSDPYNSEGIGTMGFVWDFGSVQRDPKKRYTNTGLVDSLYAVELISESMHGCRDTFVDTVVIHPDTKADFAPILTSGCAPLVLDSALINLRQYVNANDGYSWTIWGSDSSTVLSSFSGTGFNSYTMSSDGDTVYVRLITSNNYGCSNDTLVRRFVTIKDPVADFSMSDTTGCGDTQISFRDASTPSGLSLRWDFGDGDTSVQTNPSHVFGNSSNTQDSIYTVRLIVTAGSGCSDTISKDIKLYPLPLAGYGLSSSSTCAPATLSTSNTSIYKGSSFSSQWSSSHGSVQINTTSSSTPSLVFPDNDSEVDTTYSIQLLVTSVDGCKDSITDSVEVYSRPNASFSIDTGSCGAVSLLVDNHTDSLSKYGHGYKWVVSPSTGVSLNDTLYEPSIVFPINRSSSAISYRLLLTSTSNQGCEDKDTQYTVVYPKPLAKYSFSLPDSCSPDTAYFTNLSDPYNSEGIGTMGFVWDFGSVQRDPKKRYTNTGLVDSLYAVELISESMHGCRDTFVDTVVIHPDTKADFAPILTSGCAPLVLDSALINLRQYVNANDGYSWTIWGSDSSTVLSSFSGTGFNSYTMSSDGDTVYVRLITSNNYGCSNDTLVRRFVTIKDPVADFSMSDTTGCGDTQISFRDASTPSGLSLRWDFGDGDTSVQTNPSHVFGNSSNTQDSIYTVRLIVTAGSGCSDTISKDIKLYPLPLAGYGLSSSSTCAPATLSTSNTSIYKGSSFSSQWSSSHGSVQINTTSSSTPSLVFPDNDSEVDTTYSIQLLVTSVDGCKDSITDSVEVYSRPNASFSIDTGSCGAVSLLVDNHTDSLSKYGHGYKWVVSPSTGVSLNDTLYEPSIVFPINRSSSAISYRLLLTSTSNQGCEDKDTQYTVVYPKPLAKYSFSLPDSCSPDTAYFTNLSDPYNSEGIGTMGFVWDFGSVQRDPKKRYTNTGLVDSLYAVELISESMHGCRDTFVDTVVIHPDTKADFAPILTSGCAPLVLDSALINLRQYVNANDGYSWTIWGSDSSTVLSSFSGTGFNSYTMSSDGDTVYVRLITSNNYGCSNDTLVRRFVTIKDPVADFSMSDTTGCGDTQISFRDASTPSGLSLRWDFGDGDTSVQTNPSHVFGNSSNTQDSIYTVRLIVTAGSGCSDTISKDIKLYPLPLAGYGLSSSSTCAPATLSTSNTSIYKGSSFSSQWSSSHGSVQINTTSSSTPSLVFPDNDSEVDTTYSIQLLVTSVDGCKDSITDSVEVYSRPNASFSIDTGSCGAVSLLVDNHTDSLSKYGHGYKWVVSPSTGVSLNDTLYEPSIVFPINRSSSAISYRLLLTSTSNQGCEDKDTQYTVVYPKPLAKYSFSLPDSCSPDTAYFTNLSDPYNSEGIGTMGFVWDFGSVQRDPKKRYTNTGLVDSLYAVELISESMHGCRDTFVDTVVIHPDTKADFAPILTSGCAPLVLDSALINLRQYVNANDGYSWTIWGSDSSTVLSSFSGTGFNSYTMSSDGDTVYVRLITSNNYGCSNDTLVRRFVTIKDPVADFSMSDTTGCGDTQISFRDASTPSGLSLRWDFGDGDTSVQTNPSHVFGNSSNTQDSIYTVRLIVRASSGCYDTIQKQFTAFGEPLANFGALEACEYKNTVFTDSSLAGGAPISNWGWDFGDASTDTVQNPNHRYNQDGLYKVQLVVINGHGCIDSITKSVTSYPIPIVNFANDTIVCEKDSISFTNSTTGAVQYDWSFGNGKTDQRRSPNAFFDTTGYYTIRQIATSDFGCFDSLSSLIQVIGAPQASFIPSIDEGCAPLEVTFTNTSLAAYADYTWYYGQGDSSMGLIPDTITYLQGRHDTTYYVRLVASNQCKIDTFVDSILVHPTPVALFETDRDIGCSPLNLRFSNNLSYGDPDTLIWNFGDGSPLYKTTKFTFDEPLSHIYTTDRLPSDYTITYIAKNECGADTTDKTITVYKTVEAFFNTDTLRGCMPLTVNFTNSSKGYIDYAWDFGDGNVSNVNNPSHTFNQSGTFTVKLFVTDSCSYDTFEQEILIYPEPILSFDFIRDSVCQFDSIRFRSTSTDISGVYWDFGDGKTSVLTNPTHQYTDSGIFNVQYTGYSTLHNCPATISKDVHILDKPESSITASPTDGCQPLTVNFKADSSFNSWTFSNGNSSVKNDPKEIFGDVGVQWVKLVSEYANGCKDSISINLIVHPRPLAGYVASVDSLCEYPVDVDYTNTSIGALGYNWIFGDGSRSTQTSPSLTLTQTGIYKDTLIASNQFGCKDTATSIIKVYDPPTADALITPLSGCVPLEVNFTNVSSNYLYNKWDFGNGDTSSRKDDIYTYEVIGAYAPSLIVYGNANCSDTFDLSSVINVYPNPMADFDFEIENVTTTFTNISSGADRYSWDFGDGASSTEENPVHRYPGSGIYNTTLVASNSFGCKDSLTKMIDVLEMYNLFVSNAFSPEFGGPGANTFKPTGIGLETYHIYIYDTWGNLIWESDQLSKTEPLEGWDGKDVAGNDMPQDTYVWKISAKFLNGRIWPGKVFPDGSVKRFGTVTLIR